MQWRKEYEENREAMCSSSFHIQRNVCAVHKSPLFQYLISRRACMVNGASASKQGTTDSETLVFPEEIFMLCVLCLSCNIVGILSLRYSYHVLYRRIL